jgi:DNA invertase Pin-like site-specific DNA recombinase
MTTPHRDGTTRAFVYLRVSGYTQIHGDGYDRQLLACEGYATAHGIEIAEVFRESITGTSDLEGRPAFGNLLAALEENGIKMVIVERLDRLARDLLIQETIIGDMQRHNYTLISCYEPDLCSTDPSRVLMRQIFGAIAQYDRSMTVLKLQAAKARKRASDPQYRDGPPRYGEKPGEAEVLAAMREMRTAGATLERVRDDLNARGMRARSGKLWTTGTVHRILGR